MKEAKNRKWLERSEAQQMRRSFLAAKRASNKDKEKRKRMTNEKEIRVDRAPNELNDATKMSKIMTHDLIGLRSG
jgi:hypothetical protein